MAECAHVRRSRVSAHEESFGKRVLVLVMAAMVVVVLREVGAGWLHGCWLGNWKGNRSNLQPSVLFRHWQ
jgi:hypothetical protein